jgi:hypothetical protein
VSTRHCLLCKHELTPTELHACADCVSETRADLHAIHTAYLLLPYQLGLPANVSISTVMGIGNDDAPIPGGDVLVMLGPGSAHTRKDGLRFEGDPNDPPVVAFELATWCEDWASHRHEEHWPNTVRWCIPWLNARLSWGLDHHPAAQPFVDDMQRIRARLESVTGSGERPEQGESCPYCGATVERLWTKHGLDDDWTCPRCKRRYTPAQLRSAVLSVLAQNETQG